MCIMTNNPPRRLGFGLFEMVCKHKISAFSQVYKFQINCFFQRSKRDFQLGDLLKNSNRKKTIDLEFVVCFL